MTDQRVHRGHRRRRQALAPVAFAVVVAALLAANAGSATAACCICEGTSPEFVGSFCGNNGLITANGCDSCEFVCGPDVSGGTGVRACCEDANCLNPVVLNCNQATENVCVQTEEGFGFCDGSCGGIAPTATPTETPTATPTETPTESATPTETPTETPIGADGDDCVIDDDCISGNCVDDTCCADPSCPDGQACNVPGSAGSCAPSPTAPLVSSGGLLAVVLLLLTLAAFQLGAHRRKPIG